MNAEWGGYNEVFARRVRIACVAGMLVLSTAIWLIGQGVISIYHRYVSEMRFEAEQLRRRARSIPQLKEALIQALAERDRARQQWERARRRLPLEPKRAELLAQLLMLADVCGVRIDDLQEATGANQRKQADELRFAGVATGSYTELARWLWELEHLERYIRLTELTMQADKDKCRMTFVLVAPFGSASSTEVRRGNSVARAGRPSTARSMP